MDQKKGRIISSVGGLYTVRVREGEDFCEYSCQARGIFRHSNTKLLVGDVATLAFSDADNSIVIDAIDERKNSLIRPPLANLDVVFVTMAAKSPAPMLSPSVMHSKYKPATASATEMTTNFEHFLPRNSENTGTSTM